VHPSLKFSVLCAVLMLSACNASKPVLTPFHRGPWEQRIGFSQAIQVGNRLYISGCVGDASKTFEEQMKQAYSEIQETLDHYKIGLSSIVMERIYTTDMESLIKFQETRKSIYGEHLPAATWVEVKGLYQKGLQIEIEVEVTL